MCRPSTSANDKTIAGSSGDGNGSTCSTIIDHIIVVALFFYTIGFVTFRIGELVPLYSYYTLQCNTVIIGALILSRSNVFSSSRWTRCLSHIASIIALIYILDNLVPKSLPPLANDGNESLLHSNTKKTVVVTGANAGVGRETSRQLAVNYGVHVIMGCRSMVKCTDAANAINEEIVASNSKGSVTPLVIDLSNLHSIKSFVAQLKKKGYRNKIDVLFNNAGYVPPKNLPVNEIGLDPSFASMHLGHFYLTEQLIKLQHNNQSMLRVVNTASGTHHICAIPFAYIPSFILTAMEYFLPPNVQSMILPHANNPGCITDDYLSEGITSPTSGAAYIEAKLANVMHVLELPKKHRGRVTAVAIDLGWVGTSIQPWMKGSLSPTSLGWMRSANVGVAPMIHAILSSNEELTDGLNEGERMWEESGGIIMNIFGQSEEAFSYPWWKEGKVANLSKDKMVDMSDKLWKKSIEILKKNGY